MSDPRYDAQIAAAPSQGLSGLTRHNTPEATQPSDSLDSQIERLMNCLSDTCNVQEATLEKLRGLAPIISTGEEKSVEPVNPSILERMQKLHHQALQCRVQAEELQNLI